MVLSQLNFFQEEHLAIRQRKNPEDPIDWNDYKSMKFTRAVRNSNFAACLIFFFHFSNELVQVIYETSRLATVVNGVLRKTTKEMELNGT